MQKHSHTLLAVCLFMLPTAVMAKPPSPPHDWTDGYIVANGIRIYYLRTAIEDKHEKPTLLLAHGSSDDGLTWTNLAKELQADFDIVMPDARGHGRSDPPSKSQPADAQAEDLAGIIRELKLDKPIVMGHSMGSASVAWFAAKYPDIPRAVVLEDPRLISPKPNDPRLKSSGTATQKRFEQILARNNSPYEQLLKQCIERNAKWELSECEYWAPSKQMHHPATAFGNLSQRPPMSDLLPKIAAPTLILKADAEPQVRKQEQAIADLLPNGKLVHIDGAGHSVRRDQKLVLLKTLKEFLHGLQ